MQLYSTAAGFYALRLCPEDLVGLSGQLIQFKLDAYAISVFALSKNVSPIPNTPDVVLTFSDTSAFDASANNGTGMAHITGKDLRLLISKLTAIQPLGNKKPESKPQNTPQASEDQELSYFKNHIQDVKIEGRYKPLDHQYIAAFFKATHNRAFDLSTMRTGKTGSTMLALEYLFRKDLIHRVMIVAPLTCVRPVWCDAIQYTMPRHIAVAVTGTKQQRLKAFEARADIFITNYESIKLHPKEWRKLAPDAIVIDECTHYANLTSDRTKAMKSFIEAVKPSYVWGLTGTPGYDPLKAFAMSKVINPNAVAVRTLTAWKDLTMYRWGAQAWQWKNKDCAPQMIKQALSPAILFKKDDLFNLPPVVYSAREVEQSKDQGLMMDKLRSDMVAIAQTGEQITAQQKSTLISKLLQCATGTVYTDDNNTIELDIDKRIETILDLINEASGKVVIFSAFTGAINRLQNKLTSHGIQSAVVNGATSEKERADIFRKFQNVAKGKGEVDVLIAHPRTTAFGVELSAADTMIFDGAPLSGDFVFGQAVERLSSLKQKAKQISIVQVYSCTEERKVFKSLLDGQTQSQVVSDLFDNIVR